MSNNHNDVRPCVSLQQVEEAWSFVYHHFVDHGYIKTNKYEIHADYRHVGYPTWVFTQRDCELLVGSVSITLHNNYLEFTNLVQINKEYSPLIATVKKVAAVCDIPKIIFKNFQRIDLSSFDFHVVPSPITRYLSHRPYNVVAYDEMVCYPPKESVSNSFLDGAFVPTCDNTYFSDISKHVFDR